MQEAEEAGHTHSERRELALNSATLLETDANEVESRIDALLSGSHLVPTEPDWLQLPGSDRAEQTLAKSLRDLLHAPLFPPPCPQSTKPSNGLRRKQALVLLRHNQEASARRWPPKFPSLQEDRARVKRPSFEHSFQSSRQKDKDTFGCTDRPGHSQNGGKLFAFRPNRSSFAEVRPSHGGFTMNDRNPLTCDFLIMDETSMLDVRLAAALVRAIPPQAHLLLVGDADQLPSVGSGNALKDLLTQPCFR